MPSALPADLEARVWRAYFSTHVLPGAIEVATRRHFSRAVTAEIRARGRGTGRMWRAFVSSDNVVVGVSRATDDDMSELEVRTYVAGIARRHVAKRGPGATPTVEIREIGTKEVHVFDGRGTFDRTYLVE